MDGSLSEVTTLSLQPIFPDSITVDASAKYLLSSIGTYLIDPIMGTLSPTPNKLGANPMVADRIGEFVFTGNPTVQGPGVYSYQIDTASGLLTPAPGSPLYDHRYRSGNRRHRDSRSDPGACCQFFSDKPEFQFSNCRCAKRLANDSTF